MLADWLAGRSEPPVARLVGFHVTAGEAGTARVELDAGPRHHNPMGIVHGGVLCDIADAAMGVAVATTLAQGESFATVSLAGSYLRPVVEGHLTAVARTLHRGRTIAHLECDVTDAAGHLVARFTSTCAITH
jgi:uncharacterized protein (TIGR00369 family)